MNKIMKRIYAQEEYSILNYILLFFTFSFLGWIYEILLEFVKTGILVNKGALFGPWLTIYGYGGVVMIILLKRFKKKPWLVFLLAIVIAGILEYATAWYLETFLELKYWDYSGMPLNIEGRTCLPVLLLFALGGMIAIYYVGPFLNKLYNKIKPKIKMIICIILLILFGIDKVHSYVYPNSGEGITTNVTK